MVLLRRVIGGALRARRQGQHRTLREVSTAANVSLGYLSEIERGQKEASSELLAAICDALGAQLSDVLRQVSDSLAVEEMEQVLAPVGAPAEVAGAEAPTPTSTREVAPADTVARAALGLAARHRVARRVAGGDGEVSVSVRHDAPLRTTLKTTRPLRGDDIDLDRDRERDVVYA